MPNSRATLMGFNLTLGLLQSQDVGVDIGVQTPPSMCLSGGIGLYSQFYPLKPRPVH